MFRGDHVNRRDVTVESVFHRPKEKRGQADLKKATRRGPFDVVDCTMEESRQLFQLVVLREFYTSRSMRRAQDVRKQLLGIMDRYVLLPCETSLDLAESTI